MTDSEILRAAAKAAPSQHLRLVADRLGSGLTVCANISSLAILRSRVVDWEQDQGTRCAQIIDKSSSDGT